MTRTEINTMVRERLGGGARKEIATAVAATFDVIREALAAGETVKISNFGRWFVRDKAARRGRNPRTGEPLRISARRVVRFCCSPGFRRRLNDLDAERG